jgi:hypothetical protein
MDLLRQASHLRRARGSGSRQDGRGAHGGVRRFAEDPKLGNKPMAPSPHTTRAGMKSARE